MIAIGIRKFARERNLTCHGGFAYGRLNGRFIALDEGAGYKRLQVYLYSPAEEIEDAAGRDAGIMDVLTGCNLQEFRLHQSGAVTIQSGFARLVFHDTVGTMARIIRYIDEILPRLDELGLRGNACACCARDLAGDEVFVQLSGRILPVHPDCARELDGAVEDADRQGREGSFFMGLLGALVGALIGAAAYALMFSLGKIAAVAGLLLGRISSELYDRFGGKRSKWKLLAVAIALLLGVTLGQVAGYTVMFGQWYDEIDHIPGAQGRASYIVDCWEFMIYDQETALGRQYDRNMADIPEAMRISREDHIRMNYMRENDIYREEALHEFAVNYRIGMLLGLLGCVPVFMEIFGSGRAKKLKYMR